MASAGFPVRSGVLPTTKHRRGRITPRQARALASGSSSLVPLEELAALLAGRPGPVVVDIGFGTGDVVEHYARCEPDRLVVAVDMHTPGIGDLLARISEGPLDNVVVVQADAREVLSQGITAGRLTGVRTFFPDPWPKARHHRRRFVRQDVLDLLAKVLTDGAEFRFATDHAAYCTWALARVLRHGAFAWTAESANDWRQRPADWPPTRYEERARAAGRAPVFLTFRRLPRS